MENLNKDQLDTIQEALNTYCIENKIKLTFHINYSESVMYSSSQYTEENKYHNMIRLLFTSHDDNVHFTVFVGELPENLSKFLENNTLGVSKDIEIVYEEIVVKIIRRITKR